jgi:hypothetical protein
MQSVGVPVIDDVLAAALVLPAASGWRNERDVHDFPPGRGAHHD